MKKISEGFVKAAAKAGDAIREGRSEGYRFCPKPAEWAELEQGPSVEQVLRHMLDCSTCMGTATFALLTWTARMRVGAVKAAVRELVRKEHGEN